jgi:undecaprenyl-diphosphatase
LLQLDRPLQEYMRSLHVLWVERVGDLLHHLGSGGGLVTISVMLLVVGYGSRHHILRAVGVESLIAHGAAAVVVQVAKHLIGRPRPRLLRDGEFLTGPSIESGLDSFPSGHAAASFAVATVVARHYPRWGGAVYGLAGLVTISRVVRGSHFVTDVIAGVVLGVLVGAIVSAPLKDWRAALACALASLTPYVAGAFAILWTLCQPVGNAELQAMMLWTGSIVVAFGAGSRWGSAYRGEPTAFLPYATPAIAVGVALTTGAWVVVLVVGLVLCARWLARDRSTAVDVLTRGSRALVAEVALAVILLLTVLSLQSVKGLLLLG